MTDSHSSSESYHIKTLRMQNFLFLHPERYSFQDIRTRNHRLPMNNIAYQPQRSINAMMAVLSSNPWGWCPQPALPMAVITPPFSL